MIRLFRISDFMKHPIKYEFKSNWNNKTCNVFKLFLAFCNILKVYQEEFFSIKILKKCFRLFYLNMNINVGINMKGFPMMCDNWCMCISRGHLQHLTISVRTESNIELWIIPLPQIAISTKPCLQSTQGPNSRHNDAISKGLFIT